MWFFVRYHKDIIDMTKANHIVADVPSKEGWSSAVRMEASLGTLKSSHHFSINKIPRQFQGLTS